MCIGLTDEEGKGVSPLKEDHPNLQDRGSREGLKGAEEKKRKVEYKANIRKREVCYLKLTSKCDVRDGRSYRYEKEEARAGSGRTQAIE